MASSKETDLPSEKLFLVYVNTDDSEDEYVELELEGLCEAAGGKVVGSIRQRLPRPHRASFIGPGKLEELKSYAAESKADMVVIDAELSGSQLRTIEEVLETRVLDRTQLILDIFASRAKTREGQLQVELAQLTYMLPRLMGRWTKFERQRGGIGMRGPGETQLERDRRIVNKRISKLKGDIDDVKRHRVLQRASRARHPFPSVAIVGYTSAGKSTLMNALSDADVLADAMPFATLDPTTRKIDLPNGFSFFLIDTVGFIRNLPTTLIAAFRATLEEVVEADLLLHIIDIKNPDWELQKDSVDDTIKALGGGDVPVITVFNKIDSLEDSTIPRKLVAAWPDSVAISAQEGTGFDDLLSAISNAGKGALKSLKALVPYDQNNLIEACRKYGRIVKIDYRDDGIYFEADLVPEMYGKLAQYEVV